MTIPRVKIGVFCQTGSGGTPSRTDSRNFDGGTIPWVKSGELKSRFVESTEELITSDAVKSSAAKVVPRGALLVAMYGATVGEVSELKIDAATNQAVCSIVPDTARCDLGYLYHALVASKPVLLGRRVGGAQPNISQGIIRSLEIPLPSINEQRRITAILDKADALRAKRREAIAKLDQLLQSVFVEMFGDPSINPKGWPILHVGDLLESVSYGSSVKADKQGDIPILRMNNLTYSGEIDLGDLKYISADKVGENHLVRPGDILFNRTNSKDLVGKTAVYEGPVPMAYAGYLVRSRVKPCYSPEYVSAFLNSMYGKVILRGMCKNIVGMANINAKEFQGISIPVPPSFLQMKFREAVQSIRHKKNDMLMQLSAMNQIFLGLQQRAFIEAR